MIHCRGIAKVQKYFNHLQNLLAMRRAEPGTGWTSSPPPPSEMARNSHAMVVFCLSLRQRARGPSARAKKSLVITQLRKRLRGSVSRARGAHCGHVCTTPGPRRAIHLTGRRRRSGELYVLSRWEVKFVSHNTDLTNNQTMAHKIQTANWARH